MKHLPIYFWHNNLRQHKNDLKKTNYEIKNKHFIKQTQHRIYFDQFCHLWQLQLMLSHNYENQDTFISDEHSELWYKNDHKLKLW